MDFFSTWYALTHHLAEEANPLVIMVFMSIGILPTLILTKLSVFAIILLIFLNKPKFTLDRVIPMLLLNVVYVIYVWNNIACCLT